MSAPINWTNSLAFELNYNLPDPETSVGLNNGGCCLDYLDASHDDNYQLDFNGYFANSENVDRSCTPTASAPSREPPAPLLAPNINLPTLLGETSVLKLDSRPTQASDKDQKNDGIAPEGFFSVRRLADKRKAEATVGNEPAARRAKTHKHALPLSSGDGSELQDLYSQSDIATDSDGSKTPGRNPPTCKKGAPPKPRYRAIKVPRQRRRSSSSSTTSPLPKELVYAAPSKKLAYTPRMPIANMLPPTPATPVKKLATLSHQWRGRDPLKQSNVQNEASVTGSVQTGNLDSEAEGPVSDFTSPFSTGLSDQWEQSIDIGASPLLTAATSSPVKPEAPVSTSFVLPNQRGRYFKFDVSSNTANQGLSMDSIFQLAAASGDVSRQDASVGADSSSRATQSPTSNIPSPASVPMGMTLPLQRCLNAIADSSSMESQSSSDASVPPLVRWEQQAANLSSIDGHLGRMANSARMPPSQCRDVSSLGHGLTIDPVAEAVRDNIVGQAGGSASTTEPLSVGMKHSGATHHRHVVNLQYSSLTQPTNVPQAPAHQAQILSNHHRLLLALYAPPPIPNFPVPAGRFPCDLHYMSHCYRSVVQNFDTCDICKVRCGQIQRGPRPRPTSLKYWYWRQAGFPDDPRYWGENWRAVSGAIPLVRIRSSGVGPVPFTEGPAGFLERQSGV